MTVFLILIFYVSYRIWTLRIGVWDLGPVACTESCAAVTSGWVASVRDHSVESTYILSMERNYQVGSVRGCSFSSPSYSLQHSLNGGSELLHTVYEYVQLQSQYRSAQLYKENTRPNLNSSHHGDFALQCRWWVLWQACNRGVARLAHAPFASEVTRVTIARQHLRHLQCSSRNSIYGVAKPSI